LLVASDLSATLSLPLVIRTRTKMMSFRTLIVIATLACVHGAVVRRSFGSSYGAAPISSYGAPAAPAPALAPAPASAPAPSYASYGAPAVSYGAPAAQAYGPIFYLEEDRPSLGARIHDFKSRIIGSLAYMKGSLLAKKGQILMKKASYINGNGERLIGLGETLKALKMTQSVEPLNAPQNYYSAPLPAAPGY